MKAVTLLLLLLLCGCASTIEDRRKERLPAYSALPSDTQALVDTGRIKVGMPKDAVYIAWGKPAQILQGESDQGRVETWVYHGSTLRPYHYWAYHGLYGSHYPSYYHPIPYLETDWYPQYYVSAEVQFENDRVKHWRSLPSPPY